MKALPDFSVAVFDLDGTLLDTLRDIAEAANRVLERHGHDPHPQEAFKQLVGDGPDVLFQRAIGASTSSEPAVLDLVEAYRRECHEQNDRHTRLYDGISELLDFWSERGVALNILTNKIQEHAEICAARFLPLWPWRTIMGSGEDVPKKPDPTGALKIAKEIGVAAEKIAYLGDTNTDMLTAKAAGMFAVGVTWGFREKQELVDSGADRVIDHPSELICGS